MNRKVIPFKDVEIKFPNFAGRKNQFNRAGDRNFNIVINDPELAAALSEDGFNVREKKPLVNEGDSYWLLEVSLSYHSKESGLEYLNPEAYLVMNNQCKPLTEDTIGCLDRLDVENIDLSITPGKPYPKRDGTMGVRAWLNKIYVTVADDPIELKYAAFSIAE